MVGEGGRGDGERGSALLLDLEPCDGEGNGQAKETLGKDVVDVTVELLEDLETILHPPGPAAETACDGRRGELVRRGEVGDDFELLP